jgi:hypothetical protein
VTPAPFLAYLTRARRLKRKREAKVRWADSRALRQDSRAVPRLLELLRDKDDEVVAAAADALGHIGSPAQRAWRELLDVLLAKSRPAWVRDTAAYALGMIGESNAVVRCNLAVAAHDAEKNVSRCAREALAALRSASPARARRLLRPRRPVLDRLPRAGAWPMTRTEALDALPGEARVITCPACGESYAHPDDHALPYPAAPRLQPLPGLLLGVECDWGCCCNKKATRLRYDENRQDWLPVCPACATLARVRVP